MPEEGPGGGFCREREATILLLRSGAQCWLRGGMRWSLLYEVRVREETLAEEGKWVKTRAEGHAGLLQALHAAESGACASTEPMPWQPRELLRDLRLQSRFATDG